MPKSIPVLIAEDNEDDVLLLKRAFQRAGFEVPIHWVPDGQEGIDYIKARRDAAPGDARPVPALIMTDLKMPKVNGFEFLSWIRQQAEYRNTPVIVLSSSADDSDVDRAYQLGANSFVTKPHSFEDLNRLIAALRDYWIAFNRFPRAPQAG